MSDRSPAEPMTFDDFYEDYLAAHRNRANRAMHLVAKLAMAAVVVWAWQTRSLWPLLLVPVVAVAPCWLGHLLFEHNRPTSWTQPDASILGSLRSGGARHQHSTPKPGRFYYSFAADLRMCAAMLGLRWGADLQRDGRSAT